MEMERLVFLEARLQEVRLVRAEDEPLQTQHNLHGEEKKKKKKKKRRMTTAIERLSD